MTPDEVRNRVEALRGISADDEMAHSEEDKIHLDVLKFIAQGDGSSLHVQLAREAIRSEEIAFARWCA